jgi:hypothetical protein
MGFRSSFIPSSCITLLSIVASGFQVIVMSSITFEPHSTLVQVMHRGIEDPSLASVGISAPPPLFCRFANTHHLQNVMPHFGGLPPLLAQHITATSVTIYNLISGYLKNISTYNISAMVYLCNIFSQSGVMMCNSCLGYVYASVVRGSPSIHCGM